MSVSKITKGAKMGEQFYVKKNGRYIARNDPSGLDGLSNGCWLVVVRGGSTCCRNFIDPKLVELDAALKYLEDGLVEAMHEAAKMRPRSVKMSKKELKAWKAYEKVMGKDNPSYFEYASLWEIANKGCEYLKKIIYENKYDPEKIKEKYGKHYIEHVEKIKKDRKPPQNSIMDLEV